MLHVDSKKLTFPGMRHQCDEPIDSAKAAELFQGSKVPAISESRRARETTLGLVK